MECVFETEEQCAEFFECLANGFVPLKFAYVGSAAHTHDRLASTEGYSVIVGSVAEEMVALRDGLPSSAYKSSCTVVELGPGNGLHTQAFIKSLKKLIDIGFYKLVDYSETLLILSLSRLEPENSDIEFSVHQFDLEDSKSHLNIAKKDALRLFLMFGNTLGNVENWRASATHLFDEMSKGDILLTSYAIHTLDTDPNNYLAGYQTKELRNAALEPLIMTGAKNGDIDFLVYFDQEELAVVGVAQFTRDAELSCSGRKSYQLKEARLRCFLSRRFIPEFIEEGFVEVGFDKILHYQNRKKKIGYLMLQKP